VNNHLFSEALTLDQLLEIFPLSNAVGRGFRPNFTQYAEFFTYHRYPKEAPPVTGWNYVLRRGKAEEKMKEDLRRIWDGTEELALMSEIVEVMTRNLMLQCSMDFVPPDATDIDAEQWTPKVRIALSSRKDCWVRLMEYNRPQGYEPTEAEIESATNEDFIREIAHYAEHMDAKECAYMTYAISTDRFRSWFRQVARYEVQTIQNELEYRKSLTGSN
jgi:hypothetical protein